MYGGQTNFWIIAFCLFFIIPALGRAVTIDPSFPITTSGIPHIDPRLTPA
jgi:hypothetical protein